MTSLSMTGTTLILHVEPDAAREVAEQLSPHLSKVSHRSVSDTTSLAAALREQPWDAVFYDQHGPGIEERGTHESSTPYSFLDSMPGMACQIRLDKQGTLHFPYVSEGCFDLFGITPLALQQQSLMSFLHPDDVDSFRQSMLLSAQHATPWNWEGRIILYPKARARIPDKTTSHPTKQPQDGCQVAGYQPLPERDRTNASLRELQDNEIKWVNLRAKHHKTNSDDIHWQGFIVNITQNKQAEIEIKLSRERLRELSAHIETIKEEERTRIAREIHDEIGVLLTALKMDLAWLTHRLPSDNSALLEKTHGMAQLLDTAGRAANDLVHSLRPGSLDCFGLVATIEIEAREFTKRTGTPCKIIKSGDHLDISNEQSITLFRVFQETLNNIMKHAAATHVRVQILKGEAATVCPNCIELIVSDDGCGFDESARNKPRSFGLRGIQERIGQLGGKVKISSKPGKGTKISVRLPLTSGS